MSISTRNRRRPVVAPEAPRQVEAFRELDADLFLGHQLFRHGASALVTGGVTGYAERKARIRAEITSLGWADRFVLDGHGNPTSETLAAAFLRLYREPLHTPQKEGTCSQSAVV